MNSKNPEYASWIAIFDQGEANFFSEKLEIDTGKQHFLGLHRTVLDASATQASKNTAVEFNGPDEDDLYILYITDQRRPVAWKDIGGEVKLEPVSVSHSRFVIEDLGKI